MNLEKSAKLIQIRATRFIVKRALTPKRDSVGTIL